MNLVCAAGVLRCRGPFGNRKHVSPSRATSRCFLGQSAIGLVYILHRTARYRKPRYNRCHVREFTSYEFGHVIVCDDATSDASHQPQPTPIAHRSRSARMRPPIAPAAPTAHEPTRAEEGVAACNRPHERTNERRPSPMLQLQQSRLLAGGRHARSTSSSRACP